MNVRRLISRAITPLHETVLQAIGVDEIVHPEEETAERLAKTLEMKGVIDSFNVSESYNIIEAKVPERYVGKTIGETDFRKNYKINVLTIIRMEQVSNIFGVTQKRKKVLGVVAPSTVMEKNDILVVFGDIKDIREMLHLE